ncbi:DHHW family protein [Xylanibacter muris]|uniref:DHHW protein n=1 Tax=Xylanibacter muris TaxID=2736290 RepID=A0ABX2AL66_9BACT|nr:DHHW family protein [Xylanibacter muris]NPD91939.1 hypothetical protein [Xylanibacter muris]
MNKIIISLIMLSMIFAGGTGVYAVAYMAVRPAAGKTAVRKKTVRRKTARRPVRRAVPRRSEGILVVDTGMNTRALEIFHGSRQYAEEYVAAVNSYKRALGDSVNVYCMVIPTAVAFYCPDSMRGKTRDEYQAICDMYSLLSDSVAPVDIFPVLQSRAGEPIYSRTDHHWAPLGAYYAAEAFAGKAGVPFRDITEYDVRTVRDYVGSMYRFSGNIAVKKAPEDFVYYVPQDSSYTTTYRYYKFDSRKNVIGVSEPEDGRFFIPYSDGHGGAYCTFMGGDTRMVKVSTSAKNGRKLMILKDSYGNALPGYLFGSFEEIHVVDFRYFTGNVISYGKDNGITDVLFANNLIHANMASTGRRYRMMMEQQ